jgi:hypothetical protein
MFAVVEISRRKNERVKEITPTIPIKISNMARFEMT